MSINRDNKGVLEFNNGDVYVGIIKDNKANGYGTMIFNNNTTMTGNFVNGLIKGSSISVRDLNVVEVGDWSFDQITGGNVAMSRGKHDFSKPPVPPIEYCKE